MSAMVPTMEARQTSRLSSIILSLHKHGATNEDSYRRQLSALNGYRVDRRTTRGLFHPTTVKIPSLESRATFLAASIVATRALVAVNMSNEAVSTSVDGEDDVDCDDDAPE